MQTSSVPCRFALLVLLMIASCTELVSHSVAEDAIDIGSRRELFVDDYLLAEMSDAVTLKVHQPTPGEVALVTDMPWEGNTCAYYTVFRDGDLYRMYYRGAHWDTEKKRAAHPEVTCYAESKDGLHWTKPKLGLYEWNGSKENNIVWTGIGTHCFVPFRDANPACPADARYKAIAAGRPQGKKGLYVFKSPDGIHWSLMQDHPCITEGAFDSQNLAFWDPHTKQYVDYHRTFDQGVRAIMTCTSPDFIHWTKPKLLRYPKAPTQHLYTNAIRPYFRAPHLRIGFPTRYLPKEQNVEPLFMSSRDGLTFRRFNEPVIPQSAPQDRSGNRSNYMANGLVSLPDNPKQLAVYGSEAYYEGPDSRLRQFLYRVDGFVSLHADDASGELVTKPIVFAGDQLELNVVANQGRVRVEIRDADNQVVEGFGLQDCQPIDVDSIAHQVRWRGNRSLGALAGKPVRIRFQLQQADLYSLRFQ